MRLVLLLLFAGALHAQTVAIVNGKPVTQAELDNFKGALPPQMATLTGDNLLRYYGLVNRMAELAEKAGLADKSPYKEQLALQRKQFLGQAMASEYGRDIPITSEDEQKFYDQHKDLFLLADVIALRIADKAKAEDIWKQLQSGADFGALAKQYPATQLTQIRRYDDNIASSIRDAVFAAKAGERTHPIAQPDGVYLFRIDRITQQPFAAVRGYAAKGISDERYHSWLASVTQSVTIEKPGPLY
jgi:parvulin-like peptidyl-prolyl isomerase